MNGEEILRGEPIGECGCQLRVRSGTIFRAAAAVLRGDFNQRTVDDCRQKRILCIKHDVENALNKIAISIPLLHQKRQPLRPPVSVLKNMKARELLFDGGQSCDRTGEAEYGSFPTTAGVPQN